MSRAQLAQFIQNKAKQAELTPPQVEYLERQLLTRSDLFFRDSPSSERPQYTEEDAKAFRLERDARAENFKREHPINHIIKCAYDTIDEMLWTAGCLEVSLGCWIIGPEDSEPENGAYAMALKGWNLIDDLERAVVRLDMGAAAVVAFELGDFCQSMTVVVRHGAEFERAMLIRQRQSEGGKASARGNKTERISRVRYYMRLGVKPTAAAESAAEDLGVSLTTIRKAFPNALLPTDLGDFPEIGSF